MVLVEDKLLAFHGFSVSGGGFLLVVVGGCGGDKRWCLD